MEVHTYEEVTAQLARAVGRVMAHPTSGRPVLLADVEGAYAFVDIGTGQSERITSHELIECGSWTWYPKATVVLDGLSPMRDVHLT